LTQKQAKVRPYGWTVVSPERGLLNIQEDESSKHLWQKVHQYFKENISKEDILKKTKHQNTKGDLLKYKNIFYSNIG